MQNYVACSSRGECEAVIAALKGRTWEAATNAEVQYVEAPPGTRQDDKDFEAIQRSQLAYLQPPSGGPFTGRLNPLLSNTGNPVKSTTSSNTFYCYGKTLGALEKFKSADALQQIAYDCLTKVAQLQQERGTHYSQQINQQKQRFQAITGKATSAVNYVNPAAVVLSPEVLKAAGTVRLFSGDLLFFVHATNA